MLRNLLRQLASNTGGLAGMQTLSKSGEAEVLHVYQRMKMQISLLFPRRGTQITIIELPCRTAGHR